MRVFGLALWRGGRPWGPGRVMTHTAPWFALAGRAWSKEAVRSARGRWGGRLPRRKVATVSFYPLIYHIAPSSVTFGDSFPPRGSLSYVGGNHNGSVLKQRLIKRYPPGLANKRQRRQKKNDPQGPVNAFPWGGRWAGRRPGRMRASVEDSSAWVIAPPAQSPPSNPPPHLIPRRPP